MKNKDKLIKIYNKALETGELPDTGLCNSLRTKRVNKKNLRLFKPEHDLYFSHILNTYWGSGFETLSFNIYRVAREFTPLRQTILAFLIAMEE